ncbi:hypothetical protein F4780DRAFT_622159 [Xylariomycetidae sp. FL0641]|nr:hypothetical protein F4780DRAFT_622159 [Xylariomycetidae sp. FL0641]
MLTNVYWRHTQHTVDGYDVDQFYLPGERGSPSWAGAVLRFRPHESALTRPGGINELHQDMQRELREGPLQLSRHPARLKYVPSPLYILRDMLTFQALRPPAPPRRPTFHPDKNPDNGEQATVTFQQIQNAHETLSNPTTRQEYDATLPQPTPSYHAPSMGRGRTWSSASQGQQTQYGGQTRPAYDFRGFGAFGLTWLLVHAAWRFGR